MLYGLNIKLGILVLLL